MTKEVYYVISDMNCQYEICRKCPKSGIFKGTHEECEAFIDGTRCSNEPNAKFCYIVELVDTTEDLSGCWSVQTDKAVLYEDSKSKCEAFKKGIEYELEEKDKMSKAQTCIYDNTESCKYSKFEFGEPVTSKCKDCDRNPDNQPQEKYNNLKFENDEHSVSQSSVNTRDTTEYMHCDDENLNNEQLSWTPYYSQYEELRNNLKSVVASDMGIDEKVNIIIALCKQIMVQVPTENPNPYVITVQNPIENPNPYNQPKVWYNYRGDQINPNDVWCNSKPNPYMPYEYYSNQLKLATVNDDLMHVPIGGTIYAELYNIIKDKLKSGIEYHECDGTRIDKKEYKTLYDIIGHKFDDVGDNAEVSDFGLPDAKGLYVRIK